MNDGVFPDFPTLLKKPLSEREVRLLERARAHAADFATRAEEHDREGTFAAENYEAMRESGYAHMTLPSEFGGEDVNLLELCAAQEQLGQGCAGTAVGINMHLFGLGSLIQDRKLAPPERQPQIDMALSMVGSQKSIMSASFSETGVPGAYHLPQTKAVKVPGGWRLRGRKSYASNLPAADMVGAWVHLVDEDAPADADPLVTMAMVPKMMEGVSTPGAGSWDVMGLRASGSWDLAFDDVFVPDMMMPPGQPATAVFAQMSAFGAWFAITVSAVYLGVAQAATDWAVNYLTSRTPANAERPLSHMAGLQYQLAEMLALNESSRAIIRTTAEDWMARPWTVEEALSKGATCKYIATNNHVRVVSLAMEIAGGPGMFRKNGIERMYRDVRGGKVHPPSDMIGLEWIAKQRLGISPDFEPRWG